MLPRRAGFRPCYSWPDLSQQGLISRYRVPRLERLTGDAFGEKSRKNPEPSAKNYISTQWVPPKVTVNRKEHFPGSRVTPSIALSRSEKPKAEVAPQVEDQHVDGHGLGKMMLQPKVRAAVARTNLLDGRQAATGIVEPSTSDSDSDPLTFDSDDEFFHFTFDSHDVTTYLDFTDPVYTTETIVAAVLNDVLDTLDLSDTLDITHSKFVAETDVTDTVDTSETLIGEVLHNVVDALDLSDTYSLDFSETQDGTYTDTAANLDGLEDIDEESMERLENNLSRFNECFQMRAVEYAAIYLESQALLEEIRGISRGLEELRQQVDERMGSPNHHGNGPADPSDGSRSWEDPDPDQPAN